MFKSIILEVIGPQQLACEGCEQRVERALKEKEGVQKAHANARNQRIEVLFDGAKIDAAGLTERIEKIGYQTRPVNPASPKS